MSLRRTAYVGLLACALCTAPVMGEDDARRSAMAGRKLSEEAVRNLESRLEAAPDDLEARAELLGYYSRRAYGSKEAKEARQRHILWLIDNRPDAPILGSPYTQLDATLDGSAFTEGKQAWLKQVAREPESAEILGKAAAYLLFEDRALAESLYKRAEAADPRNPIWPDRLGHLHALGLATKTGEAKQESAKAALAAYERSLQHMKDRGNLLPDAAKAAFEAGDLAKARSYAEEVLVDTGEDGDKLHHGHLILGRIALRADDVAKAREHLLAAGKTSGSPALNSFGPNMALARELLEKGERQGVLEYFKLCGSFWKEDRLDTWAKEVRAGKIPDFGANLEH
ncbi:MAG TPA: RNA polymerase subunit sigma-24 [Thermoanaerobaculia bacterium]|nr:RNA polymerase subunit sigma-24 [Thermoanaerobaculia bacterium]